MLTLLLTIGYLCNILSFIEELAPYYRIVQETETLTGSSICFFHSFNH